MQMHEGLRHNEGSFNKGLQELFYLADKGNKVKLVRAFPEFFGGEVPEFDVTADMVQRGAGSSQPATSTTGKTEAEVSIIELLRALNEISWINLDGREVLLELVNVSPDGQVKLKVCYDKKN